MNLIIAGGADVRVGAEDIGRCIVSMGLAPTKILCPGFAGPPQAGITYAMQNQIPFKIFSDARGRREEDLLEEGDVLLAILGAGESNSLVDAALDSPMRVHVFSDHDVRELAT